MNEIQAAYWPWWLGATALAAVAVFHLVVSRRLLGVSGSVARVVDAAAGLGRPSPEHATFLIAVVVGAFIAATIGGGVALRFDLGADFARLIGDGPIAIAVLVFGGALTGFGTRWAHGCTSGHGLCGTARLQSGSIVATTTFFGVGIAVSYLLEMLS